MTERQGCACVLIVEDEFVVALGMETTLERAGYRVLGPTPSAGAALEMLDRERPDAAFVDINLGEERGFGVARALDERGVPFAFVTGYDRRELPATYRSRPVLVKPCEAKALLDGLRRLLTPSPPD